MSGLPKVAVIQRVLPHYRAEMFARLRSRLLADGLDLRLYYGQEHPGTVPRSIAHDEQWATRLENRYLRGAGRELIWQPCLREAMDSRLVIVEQANRLLLNHVLMGIPRARRPFKLAYWGHGANLQCPKRGPSEWLKSRLVRRVDWWFAYTEMSARIVCDAGFPRAHMTVLNNMIDGEALQRAVAAFDDGARAGLRAQLGLPERHVALFCGGLRADKNLPLLWQAAQHIHAREPGFHLLVVGDGPLEMQARQFASKHPWIHFIGPKFGADVAPYLAISDLMLMPGLVGLVIGDSFVAGVPLATTRHAYHSPEISYLEPGVNGLVAEPDARSLASAVVDYLHDDELQQRLKAGCRRSAQRYTLANMVERFASGIGDCLGSRERSSVSCVPMVREN